MHNIESLFSGAFLPEFENTPVLEKEAYKLIGRLSGRTYELEKVEEGADTDRSLVADEVLSGWAVGILEKRGNLLRVVTHYGYEGLLEETSLHPALIGI